MATKTKLLWARYFTSRNSRHEVRRPTCSPSAIMAKPAKVEKIGSSLPCDNIKVVILLANIVEPT